MMKRFDPIYIEGEGEAVVRIQSDAGNACGCITARDHVVFFMAHIFQDELATGAPCLTDILQVMSQALRAKPSMINPVTALLSQLKVRRKGKLGPLLGPIKMAKWAAAIEPTGRADA